ncbi:MAG TPA: hypothetical protein VMM76_23890 [Pirellulaceae bacterium]|nr:hypothetical protein [Pirellulaceae bacterium]
MAIIVGFNFINRIADGLGVRYDVPKPLMTDTLVGRLVAPFITLGIRGQVAFERKEIPHQPANENLERLERLFGDYRLGSLPRFFWDLTDAPHLLETQWLLLSASLLHLQQERAIGGAVASAIHEMLGQVGANELRERAERWCESMPYADGLARPSAVRNFARKVGESAFATELDDIERLRSHDIPDTIILDIVFAVGVWAALARLERLADALHDETPWHPLPVDS